MNFSPIDDQLANIRQIVRKCPPVTLRRAFMRAAADWCQQTQWLRTTIPGVTSPDVRTLTLGTDANLAIVAIRDVALTDTSGGVFRLAPSDQLLWNLNTPTATPLRYAYVPEGGFALDPTPSDVFAVSVIAVVAPKETAAQVPSDILVKYSTVIEAGALAYLLMIPGEPWHDPNGAVKYQREFSSGIANGKADAQRGYNTGSMRVRGRAFGAGFRGYW